MVNGAAGLSPKNTTTAPGVTLGMVRSVIVNTAPPTVLAELIHRMPGNARVTTTALENVTLS